MTNISEETIKTIIDIKLVPDEIKQLLAQLQGHGYQSYLVGGAVRDLLLGKNPKDYDICTDALPEDVKKLNKKVADTGLKFGTVLVLLENYKVEVSTFRSEASTRQGQRQAVKVFGTSPGEDVEARDFTINGLLFNGERVIDLVGGIDDLNRKIIRAIGNPTDRFNEDALRLIRAVRLSCQLGFLIEKETLDSIRKNAALISNAAWERIRDELMKILLCDVPSRGIRLLQETGLLKYILPELKECICFDQCNPHHDKDVFDHIMAVLDNTSADPVLRLAALLHDIAKPRTFTVDEKGVGHFYYHNVKGQELSRAILNRLRIDRKTVDTVSILVREHMSKLQALRTTTVKKLIARVGAENIDKLIELQIADEAGSAPPHNFAPLHGLRVMVNDILNKGEPLTVGDLAIDGQDLIGLGFKSGPGLGRVLQEILQKVFVTPELNTREKLLEMAHRIKNR